MPSNTEAEESRVTKVLWKVLSAAVGLGTGLVVVTMWASDVKTEAHEARSDAAAVKSAIDCITPRVTAVEQKATMLDTRGNERWDAVMKRFAEMQVTDKEIQADVKEILRRLPK